MAYDYLKVEKGTGPMTVITLMVRCEQARKMCCIDPEEGLLKSEYLHQHVKVQRLCQGHEKLAGQLDKLAGQAMHYPLTQAAASPLFPLHRHVSVTSI